MWIPFDANTIPFVDRASVVACITDFGTSDYYAGALRGVLAGLLPGCSIVDVTHDIPPGDILRAGILLWEVQPSFPPRTVFLAVVDPGVGGARRPAAFSFPECDVVCPDNGIPTFLMQRFPQYRAVEIDPKRITGRPLSHTFHGRDLFAPAAARIARGSDPSAFGAPLDSPVRLTLPLLAGGEGAGWQGEVMYADRFGNAVTSIGCISFDFRTIHPWLNTEARAGRIPAGSRVRLEDGGEIPIVRTYADAPSGPGKVALVGSNGLLEIAHGKNVDGRSPALPPGTRVTLSIPA